MRLARFNRHAEVPSLARLGVVLPSDTVADLRAGYASFLHERGDAQAAEVAAIRVPGTLSALIASNALARSELVDVVTWLDQTAGANGQAQGLRGEPLFTPLAECRLHAPIRLTNLFVADDNYGAGCPVFTMKPSIAVVGPSRDIRLPTDITEICCAPGLAVVVGKGCRDVAESDAAKVIAGYFVMTNVTAASRGGMRSFEAGMYETFAPSGPWLVTKDDVANPMDLKVEMRVDDEVRRQFSTASMAWPIDRLIAFLSRMTLQPGDVIWSGAAERGPAEPSIRLGNRVESIVDRVGHIRNRVVG
jgi:hypothetical protein